MRKEIDLSIIIPVYNSELYLDRCIESVIKQADISVEIILVDDGSTDSSGRICDEYSNKYSNIIPFHKKNEGQGLARNLGIEHSSGQYITFLDSDDYVSDDGYSKIVRVLNESKADACAFSYVQHNTDGKICYKAIVNYREYNDEDIVDSFLLHFFGDDESDNEMQGVSSCMTVYRREILTDNNIRFESERVVYSEDTLFNLEFCKYARKIITIPDAIYHYCLKEDSFTHRYMKNRLLLTEALCERLEKYAIDFNIFSKVRTRINTVMWISIIDALKQEVAFEKDNGFTAMYYGVKRVIDDENVRTSVVKLRYSALKRPQRLLLFLIRHRFIVATLVIVIIRLKRGIR